MPIQQVETAELLKKDVGVIAEVRAKRVETGLSLYIKSEFMERFFRTAGQSRNMYECSTTALSGKKMYVPSDQVVRDINQMGARWHINAFNDVRIFLPDYEHYNMTFFLIKGIENGVELTLPGVFSAEVVKDFVAETRKFVKHIYVTYMKPLDMEVKIVASEAVSE